MDKLFSLESLWLSLQLLYLWWVLVQCNTVRWEGLLQSIYVSEDCVIIGLKTFEEQLQCDGKYPKLTRIWLFPHVCFKYQTTYRLSLSSFLNGQVCLIAGFELISSISVDSEHHNCGGMEGLVTNF